MRRAELALAAACCLAPGSAWALCQALVTGMNFGAYSVFDPAPLRSTATITLTCDQVPPPRVTVAVGPSANTGLVLQRALRGGSGAETVAYNVFQDASLNVIWGDGLSGGSTQSVVVPRNLPRVLTVYGAVPPRQDAGTGQYFDQLPVSLGVTVQAGALKLERAVPVAPENCAP